MKPKAPLLVLAASLLMAGCGGGGSSAVSPGKSSSGAQIQLGSVVVSIPTATSSGTVRYPQFVSPSASSISIAANGGTPQIFDVSATSSLCAAATGARNCTLTFGAPVGADTIALTIYSGANATGTVLATATSSTTVVSGTAFNLTIAMNAAIGTLVINIVNNSNQTGCPNSPQTGNSVSIVEGCPSSSGTSTITAYDPSGAQITGTAPYAVPIAISGGDPSITATPTQITAPGQTFVWYYSGAALPSSLGTSVNLNFTVGTQVVTSPLTIVRQYLYVANSNCAAPCDSGPPGGGNVAVYAFGASGSATPVRTITTSLVNPVVPLLDSSGNLYVLDNGPYNSGIRNPSIYVFKAGTSTLLRTISNIGTPLTGNQPCEDVIFDPTGQYLLLTCDDIHANGIHVIQASTNGSAVQTATLTFASFQFTIGEAFDASGNLYTAEISNNDIFEFSGTIPTTGGAHAITPANTLNGTSSIPWPSTVAPAGLGFDKAGTLYATIVSSSGGTNPNNRVSLWRTTSIPCNNCTPSSSLTGTPFSNQAPAGMAIDGAGNLYVSNPAFNTINVFTSATALAGATNPSVLRTIATGSSPGAPSGMAIGP